MDATSFRSRWERFARDQALPDLQRRPLAMVTLSVADYRRQALEFFSWGIVHENEARRRLEELLPDDSPPVLRVV